MKRIVLLLFLGGCGSPSGGPNPNPGGGSVADPGPGSGVDDNFGSVEPNDTPAEATPLGTSKGTGDVHVWVTKDLLTAGDDTDYFVFKSAPMAGQFTFNICWSGAITAMTATLWKVENGQQVMPPVHQWMGAGSCVMSAQVGEAPLVANGEYLFGLQANAGGAGSYSA